jgi:hypothetical protein
VVELPQRGEGKKGEFKRLTVSELFAKMLKTKTGHLIIMTKLTLGQAAKEANKAKSTILDAINTGKLSAPRGMKGQYEIDPAELFRVYQKTEQKPDERTKTEPLGNDTKTALLLQKIEFLEQKVGDIESDRDNLRGERDRERKQLQETIDNLRADHDRLLNVIEEQAGTVKQLTHQPEPKVDSAPALPKKTPAAFLGASVWFGIALAITAGAAAVWFWWYGR